MVLRIALGQHEVNDIRAQNNLLQLTLTCCAIGCNPSIYEVNAHYIELSMHYPLESQASSTWQQHCHNGTQSLTWDREEALPNGILFETSIPLRRSTSLLMVPTEHLLPAAAFTAMLGRSRDAFPKGLSGILVLLFLFQPG